jgi:hypothetical protein
MEMRVGLEVVAGIVAVAGGDGKGDGGGSVEGPAGANLNSATTQARSFKVRALSADFAVSNALTPIAFPL